MVKLNQITFGYEWEALVLKPDLTIVDDSDVKWIARHLRNKFTWSRTGYDDMGHRLQGNMLEIRSGIMTSYQELVEHTHLQLEEIRRVCKEKKWIFLPVGSHPAMGNAIGLHIHLGSIYEFALATDISNTLVNYAPCFAALSANSPIWGIDKQLEYKSYRVLHHADYCSIVRRFSDPELAQWTWGGDVCVKTDVHSTIELRLPDAASFEELSIQFVAFVTAFFVGYLKKKSHKFTKHQYLEYVENRMRSARYGLQARFRWDGKERDVTDILWDMMEMSDFNSIGCPGIGLIEDMLKKRQTQADFCMLIYKFHPEVFKFTKELANIVSRENSFRDYLKFAPKLPSLEASDLDEVILSYIKRETPLAYIYERIYLPYDILNQRLETLIREGKIVREQTPEYGERYTKIRK